MVPEGSWPLSKKSTVGYYLELERTTSDIYNSYFLTSVLILSSHLLLGFQNSAELNILSICKYLKWVNILWQSPYWETDNRSAGQEITQLLRDQKTYHCVHKSPQLVHFLSQLNLIKTFTPYFYWRYILLILSFLLCLFLPTGLFPSVSDSSSTFLIHHVFSLIRSLMFIYAVNTFCLLINYTFVSPIVCSVN